MSRWHTIIVIIIAVNCYILASTTLSLSVNTTIGNPPRSNLARGRKEPDVIVFGIGDSGTRGVNGFLMSAGNVRMCDNNRSRLGDCVPLFACHPFPNHPEWGNDAAMEMLIQEGGDGGGGGGGGRRRPSQLREMKALHPRQFQEIVSCERERSRVVLAGIDPPVPSDGGRDGSMTFWGYKNPRHSFALPSLFEAFGGHTAMIMVARHPYDICSGDNRGQYIDFGPLFATSSGSCMEFWLEVTSQLLSLIEEHPDSAIIVRTESLVLGSHDRADAVGKCIADVVGYEHDRYAARRAASVMMRHKRSYGGQSRSSMANEKYHSLWKKAVSETTGEMHDLAAKLGYNLTAYGGTLQERDELLLLEATSKAVC